MTKRTKRSLLSGGVDIAIITIRLDEERAVLKRLPRSKSLPAERHIYRVGDVAVRGPKNAVRRVAVTRCIGEGQSIAQQVADGVIHDLRPGAIIVVGIGGAFPSSDYSLGDVAVATHVHDLRVMALIEGKEAELDVRGAPVEPGVERVVGALQRIDLGGWNSASKIGLRQPSVDLSLDNFYGPPALQEKVERLLTNRFGPKGTRRRRPTFAAGAFVSTDALVKDLTKVQQWQQFVRKALGCEMEMAGIMRAARTPEYTCPVYGIRGISDVIGFVRDESWTEYACEVASAFAFALIRTGQIRSMEQSTDTAGSRAKSRSSRRLSKQMRPRERFDQTAPTAFQPALAFIDRGQVHSAVTVLLADSKFERADPVRQLSVAAAWQKFGFLKEASRCLTVLERSFHRLNPKQQAHCRVMGFKLLSQAGSHRAVCTSYRDTLKFLPEAGVPELQASVYRRAAISYVALGDLAAARRCVREAHAADEAFGERHARTTGAVFAAITLSLGTADMSADKALGILRKAPEAYLSGKLDRSMFQAQPLKSPVMCLFSEAALRIVLVGENPAAWICLTAAYVLGRLGSVHPQGEGFAELLSLLGRRPAYRKLLCLAMRPEGGRKDGLTKHPAVVRYLAKCQALPDFLGQPGRLGWIAMRRQVEQLLVAESRPWTQ